jgi:AcrR family transcriptional regulator
MDAENSSISPTHKRRYGGVLPEERQRARHDKLIEGALEVFGTKGFHASTVREVCVAAHLTERYFYESFKSLTDLFRAVYEHLRGLLMAETMQVLAAADRSPLGLMEPALRVYLNFFQVDRRRGRIMLVDALGIDSEVAKLSGETARDYSGLLKSHLSTLMADRPDLDISLDLLADGLIGLNVMLAARWMNDGFVEPIDKVLRTNMVPYRGLIALLESSKA